MTFEIRIAREDNQQEWNSIISKSPQGTPFHTLELAENN